MTKNKTGATVLGKDAEQRRRSKLLAQMRSSSEWRERITVARKKIAAGQSLPEIRDYLDIQKELQWQCFIQIIAEAFASPASVMLEWQIRNQSRYQMSMQLVQLAHAEEDPDIKFEKISKAIMIAAKLDEQTLELQRAMGLLKPIDENNSGGYGISSEDIQIAEQRFNTLIEQKITSKLVVERTTQPAESVALLTRSEPGGETDRMESATLVTDSTD